MLGFVLTFVFFFLVRFSSLIFSAQNEKRIVAKGAIQYGKLNSLLLAVAHVIFYFGALYEAYRRGTPFNDTYTYKYHTLYRYLQTPRSLDSQNLHPTTASYRTKFPLPSLPTPKLLSKHRTRTPRIRHLLTRMVHPNDRLSYLLDFSCHTHCPRRTSYEKRILKITKRNVTPTYAFFNTLYTAKDV